MKAQNRKLNFKKNDILELNNTKLLSIEGGTTPLCLAIATTAAVYTYYETGTKEAFEDL